jgi:hypothetical protein
MDIRVTFKRPSVEAQTEVGSFAELAGLLQEESSTLVKIFGTDMESVIESVTGEKQEATQAEAAPAIETEAQRKKREKKEAALKLAVAPAPLPVSATGTTLPPNTLNIPADGGIPPFLQRTAETAPPAAETAPILAPAAPPPPPPPAAAPPAAGPITEKVVAELIRRGAGPEEQKALVTWLAGPGIALVVAAATFDEAMACLRMKGDVKLGALLAPLDL